MRKRAQKSISSGRIFLGRSLFLLWLGSGSGFIFSGKVFTPRQTLKAGKKCTRKKTGCSKIIDCGWSLAAVATAATSKPPVKRHNRNRNWGGDCTLECSKLLLRPRNNGIIECVTFHPRPSILVYLQIVSSLDLPIVPRCHDQLNGHPHHSLTPNCILHHHSQKKEIPFRCRFKAQN